MSSFARIGILGGTLDPVHVGHLETADAARGALALDLIVFLPSRVPPHRDTGPEASPYHRFAMAALAVNDLASFEVSDLELSVPGPSYTADTLLRLQDTGLRPAQIFFIAGADAFAEIATWSRYPDVLDLAHFVAVSRPGYDAAELPAAIPLLASRMKTGTPDAASASSPAVFLVNAATPDVSSTEIRRRLRSGESVHGLVPPTVETHIRRHRLYLGRPASDGIHLPADHLHDQN